MDDLLKSITEWFKERSDGQFYSVVFASILIWDWKMFYVLFWSSSIPTELTRIEYALSLSKTSFDIPDLYIAWTGLSLYQLSFVNVPIQWIVDLLIIFIPVSFISFIVIKVLPAIHKIANAIYYKNKFERQLEATSAKNKYLREKENILKSSVSVAEDVAKLETKLETKLVNEETLWQSEFHSLEPSFIKLLLKKLTEVIYTNQGHIKKLENNYYVQMISAEMLANAESYDLIEFNEERTKIKFTKKGLFFNSFK